MKFKKTSLAFFMIFTLLVGCSNKDNTKFIDELGDSETQSDAIQDENMQLYSGNLSYEEYDKKIVSSVLLDQSENLLTQTMLCFYQIPSNININPNDIL